MAESLDTLPYIRCDSDAMIVPVLVGKATRFSMRCQVCGFGSNRLLDCKNDAVDDWNGGPSTRTALEALRR